MWIIKRFYHRNIVEVAQFGVHYAPHIWIQVDRKNAGNVIARCNGLYRFGNALHAITEIFPSVRGDADNSFAGKFSFQGSQVCGQRGIGLDLGCHPIQRIDYRIAGDMNLSIGNCFASQGFGRYSRWREMLIGDVANYLAVHFLRPGLVDIVAAQASLHMANRYLAIIGCQRADHRGSCVALNDHAVGSGFVEYAAYALEQSRG